MKRIKEATSEINQ
jgi:hypothetical protein